MAPQPRVGRGRGLPPDLGAAAAAAAAAAVLPAAVVAGLLAQGGARGGGAGRRGVQRLQHVAVQVLRRRALRAAAAAARAGRTRAQQQLQLRGLLVVAGGGQALGVHGTVQLQASSGMTFQRPYPGPRTKDIRFRANCCVCVVNKKVARYPSSYSRQEERSGWRTTEGVVKNGKL